MTELATALADTIADGLPTIGLVFASIIGLVFLFALGSFIVRRVRGSVK